MKENLASVDIPFYKSYNAMFFSVVFLLVKINCKLPLYITGLYIIGNEVIKFIERNIERFFNHPLKRLKFDRLLIKSNGF